MWQERIGLYLATAKKHGHGRVSVCVVNLATHQQVASGEVHDKRKSLQEIAREWALDAENDACAAADGF